MPVEEVSASRLSSLPPADLLKIVNDTGERFSREELVPLNKIVTEEIIVDEEHARHLGNAMLGPWRQTQSVLLRARQGGERLTMWSSIF